MSLPPGRVPGLVRHSGWVLLAAASLALTACGGGAAPTVTASDDITATKGVVPDPQLPETWPLTGLPVGDDGVVRPALAVKIENDRAARPQTGLEQADVVWEEMVEGGLTRFVAVYHSQVPEEVGPIRSNRPMDARIVGPTEGLVAFSGGQYTQLLRDAGLQVLSEDGGTPGFFRKSGIGIPHNVYGRPSVWWEVADESHAANPPEQPAFARTADRASAVTAGTPAATVEVTISNVSKPTWAWDAASGTWLRSEGATASSSRAGVRLAATNVVVLSVEVVLTEDRDPAGARVPDTKLEGSGEALVATGGQTVAAVWTKASTTDPLVLTTADGATIMLAPGNTWVELMPSERSWAVS
ncbi:MAG: DUF3048 domain-containing protein [Micrococcales bacterium]|nr:DUF3048 domain-containing protein [Micrococcales bacterium]